MQGQVDIWDSCELAKFTGQKAWNEKQFINAHFAYKNIWDCR